MNNEYMYCEVMYFHGHGETLRFLSVLEFVNFSVFLKMYIGVNIFFVKKNVLRILLYVVKTNKHDIFFSESNSVNII